MHYIENTFTSNELDYICKLYMLIGFGCFFYINIVMDHEVYSLAY